MRKIHKIRPSNLLILLLLICINIVKGQNGSCNFGMNIAGPIIISTNVAFTGEVTIANSTSIFVSTNGTLDILGSLTNNISSNIKVESNGVLNVYGNLINKSLSELYTNGTQAVINLYGQKHKVETSAVIDYISVSGALNYVSPRPTISATLIAANSCLNDYSGGRFTQEYAGELNPIDIVPIKIKVNVKNSQNLSLSSPMMVNSGMSLMVDSGDVILNNHNLIIGPNSYVSNLQNKNMVVTNGTGYLEINEHPVNTQMYYPVGRAEYDFSSARITNKGSQNDTFFIQVKNYSESLSDEFNPTNGMDRTWNIYSSKGSAIDLILLHNSATNGTSYTSDSFAFVTRYQGYQWVSSTHQWQGVWELGTGGTGTYQNGPYSGTSLHSRSYSNTATSKTANSAFYSISTNILQPLPIKFIDFTASPLNTNMAILNWKTSEEIDLNYFEIHSNKNGQFQKIGHLSPNYDGSSIKSYSFIDSSPIIGRNLYKIVSVFHNGQKETSEIRLVDFNDNNRQDITLYPNPSKGIVSLVNADLINEFKVINHLGETVFFTDNKDIKSTYNFSFLADGIYTILINDIPYKWVKLH